MCQSVYLYFSATAAETLNVIYAISLCFSEKQYKTEQPATLTEVYLIVVDFLDVLTERDKNKQGGKHTAH